MKNIKLKSNYGCYCKRPILKRHIFIDTYLSKITLLFTLFLNFYYANGQLAYDLYQASSNTAAIGVWKSGKIEKDGHYSYQVVTSSGGWNGFDDFITKWKNYSEDGYRLVDIESASNKHIAGVFELGNDAYSLIVHSTWSAFTDAWKKESNKGLRLIDFEMMNVKNQKYFVGVFRAGKGGYYLWRVSNWDKLNKKVTELHRKGYSLIDVEVDYFNPYNSSYTGVWVSGNTGLYIYRLQGWKSFTNKWKELADKNYRLVDIELQYKNKKPYYIGVWHYGKEGYYLWGGKYKSFQKEVKKIEDHDLQLVDIEFYTHRDEVSPPVDPPITEPEPQKKNICLTTPVPQGWITTDFSINGSCPVNPLCTARNAKVITKYQGLPVKTKLIICAYEQIPNGWTFVAGTNIACNDPCSNAGPNPSAKIIVRIR